MVAREARGSLIYARTSVRDCLNGGLLGTLFVPSRCPMANLHVHESVDVSGSHNGWHRNESHQVISHSACVQLYVYVLCTGGFSYIMQSMHDWGHNPFLKSVFYEIVCMVRAPGLQGKIEYQDLSI